MRTEKLAWAVCLMSMALVGCQKKSATSPDAPAGKSVAQPAGTASSSAATISIASILPDTSQPLRAGEKVKVKVEADYVLPGQGGMVGLIIQGSDNKPIESTLKKVSGPAGKFITEIDFVVPNHKQLIVHVPLYIAGETKSAQVAMKQYQISPK